MSYELHSTLNFSTDGHPQGRGATLASVCNSLVVLARLPFFEMEDDAVDDSKAVNGRRRERNHDRLRVACRLS